MHDALTASSVASAVKTCSGYVSVHVTMQTFFIDAKRGLASQSWLCSFTAAYFTDLY